jgi:predicted membrane protein
MRPTSAAGDDAAAGFVSARTSVPALITGLVLMCAGTAYPRLLADATGRADHALALAVFWAMTAGFVRGVGFIPRQPVLRWAFSGWACAASLGAAAFIRAMQ